MPTYEIILRGDNFLIEREGHEAKHGFYALRTIESETLEAAEFSAVDLIREQLQERVLNDAADTPIVVLEGYNVLRERGSTGASETAFTFFQVVPKDGQVPPVHTPLWWRWLGKS